MSVVQVCVFIRDVHRIWDSARCNKKVVRTGLLLFFYFHAGLSKPSEASDTKKDHVH